MRKKKEFTEFDFLDLFYQEMIKNGDSYKSTRLTVNNKLVEEIYENHQVSLTLDELKKLANLSKANDWIDYGAMCGCCYKLSISGLGVVKSKRLQKEQYKKRSLLKKLSDSIEEHNGLFVLLGVVIAFAVLLIRYWNINNGN